MVWAVSEEESFGRRKKTTHPRKCTDARVSPGGGRQHQSFLRMATSYARASSIIAFFVGFFLLLPPPAFLLPPPEANGTLHSGVELEMLRRVRARLRKLQKLSVKTIQVCHWKPLHRRRKSFWWVEFGFSFLQSGEGDLIDCVPSHLQPAFDHPKLLGQKPLVSGHSGFGSAVSSIFCG